MGLTLDLAGDPHIGVFTRIVGDMAFVGPSTPPVFVDALRSEMNVEVAKVTIQDSEIIGSLLCGNSAGLIVSGLASPDEIAALEEYGEVLPLIATMNAAGNIILANDVLAVVHPEMDPETEDEISSFLGVPVLKLTFGSVKTVGMVAVATNKGILVHPRTTKQELMVLEGATDLPVGTGSVNLGSVLIGSGLIANDVGYIAGSQTSGFELGRIEEVFGFLE